MHIPQSSPRRIIRGDQRTLAMEKFVRGVSRWLPGEDTRPCPGHQGKGGSPPHLHRWLDRAPASFGADTPPPQVAQSPDKDMFASSTPTVIGGKFEHAQEAERAARDTLLPCTNGPLIELSPDSE